MKGKIACISILITIFVIMPFFTVTHVHAQGEETSNEAYVIYDENGEYLFERVDVKVGDEHIDKALNKYEVIYIDEHTHTGRAKFIKSYAKPKISSTENGKLNVGATEKKVALYMTHNDESYISGDGYDSIYGAGGIHDVAKVLKSELEKLNCNVKIDETLHIPHDTNAYTRSNITAKNLISTFNPAGIFDIHRDGASRGTYVKTVNGSDYCQVRIVTGKANPNYELNEEFAIFLLSIAEDIAPNLFLDIFIAKGNYNQALSDKALLFEMGSHLVEKSLVIKTIPDLANVINVGLFGNLTSDELVEQPTINSPSNSSSNSNENATPTPGSGSASIPSLGNSNNINVDNSSNSNVDNSSNSNVDNSSNLNTTDNTNINTNQDDNKLIENTFSVSIFAIVFACVTSLILVGGVVYLLTKKNKT